MTDTIYEDFRSVLRDAPVPARLTNHPALKADVEKLRSAIMEGMADKISLPEITTDNTKAAHDLLGCTLFRGLLFMAKVTYKVPDDMRFAIHKVLIEAITGMAYRLITEGQDCLRGEYGRECNHEH